MKIANKEGLISSKENSSKQESVPSTFRILIEEVAKYKIPPTESKLTFRAQTKLPLLSLKQYALEPIGNSFLKESSQFRI
jgi:hypothetical protein